MADNRVDTPSVVERTRPIAPAGSGIVDAHFLGRIAAFVRGAEVIPLVSPEGETRRSPPALDRQANRGRDRLSPATVSRVLRRLGLNKLSALDPALSSQVSSSISVSKSSVASAPPLEGQHTH
jgi:hypothetical protein